MKVAHCCFVSFLLVAHFDVVIIIVAFLDFFSCFSFFIVFLINFVASLSIAFHHIMVKYSFKITTWLYK